MREFKSFKATYLAYLCMYMCQPPVVIEAPDASTIKEPADGILSVLCSSRYHGSGAEPEIIAIPKALLRRKKIKKISIEVG